MPALKRLQEGTTIPAVLPKRLTQNTGLNWTTPKAAKLQVSSGTTSTRYIIHEAIKQKRDGRQYIYAKPYVRVVARLAPVPKEYADVIPPFKPFQLYADSKPVGSTNADSSGEQISNVDVQVIELLGGILPGEDGQSLNTTEVQELVEKAQVEENFAAGISQLSDAIGGSLLEGAQGDPTKTGALPPPNTTVLPKTVVEADVDSIELEGAKKVVVMVGENDSLQALLVRNGARDWQAEAMVEAARKTVADVGIASGDEVHVVLVPRAEDDAHMEPARFSLFGIGHQHKVSVIRDDSGEFVGSINPPTRAGRHDLALDDGDSAIRSTLYASIYHACLLQNIPPDTILKILKVHAYTTDFRRRVSAGDTLELFFNFSDPDMTNGAPGQLLMAQITSRGEKYRFYRFRSKDGEIDFYDERGNNSKKFLMRKPVRGSDVRFTSGYGMRYHPVLKRRRMHRGVDWAARPGTPVLAAGRGTIVYAGRKGAYGNYVRIRHANGYATTYAHMRRLGRGVRSGVKVRQGQVIGYVGTTGLSSGPHLHFEILVNKRFVNPMRLNLPRERQLDGRDLLEFRKEVSRLDGLISRAPVLTASK